ncbi:hypothetical protein D7322_07790 [Sphingobacterium puteale]|uniref:Pr6Pr family membrane protein n=2 Tax=Sphingobacterium puteale TaxID=2420510 RepID=A0A420W042_9SPHI|nr:hypothetical protein D7322_07790 [Sphingobacterium puteale]
MGMMILTKKSLVAFIALLSWIAIIAQFLISMSNATISTGDLVVRFFSYFTILTNLMVAICCSSAVLFPQNVIGRFFVKPAVVTAITLYILIVGLIYNTVLRYLWQPVGITRVVDEMLHSIVPILVLIHWWCSLDKAALQWRSVFSWLLYPFLYLLYTLWHGAISGFYPYPFIDVSMLGMNQVLTNSLIVALVFVFIGLLLILINRRLAKRR